MKKTIIFLSILVAIVLVGFFYRKLNTNNFDQKIYVAVEGEGKIVVIDPLANRVVSSVDLSSSHEGGKLIFAPHNVQVSPDNKTVWVTANAGSHKGHSFVKKALAHEGESEGEPDEIIVIDPETDSIIKRIAIEPDIHLAHVVVTSDGRFAYATAQNKGAIYKINAQNFEVVDRLMLPQGSEPHGIRINFNDTAAYVALLKGKGLGILTLSDLSIKTVGLSGSAVQAGVARDNNFAFVSVYENKSLALYDTRAGTVSYIRLPAGAKGPIQMYPTPDSKYVYIADQGYYFGQPIGERVYKIDIRGKKVVSEIKAGKGPHGVVVSNDGKYVYVTNLLSADISVIDTSTDKEVGRIKVGKEPNGISIWEKP